VNHRLRIAMALVAVSGGFEFWTYVGVIENFAVVGDPQRVVLVGHRLAAGSEVDDAQAAVAECNFPLHVKTRPIGTTVGDDVRHVAHDARVGRGAVGVENSRYAAHKTSIARLLPARGQAPGEAPPGQEALLAVGPW